MDVSRTQLLTTLTETHSILVRLTSTLPDSVLDFHAAPTEWSIREILAHLVDDEMFVVRLRVERMVAEENPALAPHDEKAWYSERNTARDAVAELLHDFQVQRAASLNILTFLRESDWARTGSQPEYGALSVETWVEHWAEHDLVHIQQIERTIALAEAVKK